MGEYPCVSGCYDNDVLPHDHLDMDIHYHADVETDCGHSDSNTSSSKQQHKQKQTRQTDEQMPSGRHRTRSSSLEGNDLDVQRSNRTPFRKQSSVDEKISSSQTHRQDSNHAVAATTATTTATKVAKGNSGSGSHSFKKKHQHSSGSTCRSQSGPALYQQQQVDSNPRLPVVKSCSGK